MYSILSSLYRKNVKTLLNALVEYVLKSNYFLGSTCNKFMVTSSEVFGSDRPAVVFALHNSLSNNRVVCSSGKTCMKTWKEMEVCFVLYLFSYSCDKEECDGIWVVRINMISMYIKFK